MQILNLDTHILVHAFNGTLRRSEQTMLERCNWSVSAIVLWELAKHVQLGRIGIDLGDREVIKALERVKVWPIDLEIVTTSTRLDFDGDPADQIIAATSIVHGVPLVTRDRVIRKSRLVPMAIWGERQQ